MHHPGSVVASMKRVNQLTPQFISIATHGLFASALRVLDSYFVGVLSEGTMHPLSTGASMPSRHHRSSR
jgi:hypothetical protein